MTFDELKKEAQKKHVTFNRFLRAARIPKKEYDRVRKNPEANAEIIKEWHAALRISEPDMDPTVLSNHYKRELLLRIEQKYGAVYAFARAHGITPRLVYRMVDPDAIVTRTNLIDSIIQKLEA